MKNSLKKILMVVIVLTLLLALGDKAKAEFRSGFSFTTESDGLKLIEYFILNESFYLDLKSDYVNQEKTTTRIGYRRYSDKNNGLFTDLSVIMKEDQNSSDEGKMGFGLGGGYVFQLSELYFLNIEGGYNTADLDFYFGGSLDLSWSNLRSKLGITGIDINSDRLQQTDRVQSPRRQRNYIKEEIGNEEVEDIEKEEVEDTDEEEGVEDSDEEGVDYFIYQGRGTEHIEINEEYKSGILALHGNIGTRKFSAIGYDKNGDEIEDFRDDNDSYRGRSLIYFKPKEETMYLEIELPGSWQLISLPQIKEIADVVKPPVEISGVANSLIAIKENPSTITITGNQKAEYFEVIIWQANLNKRTIVKTNQPYDDSIRLPQSGVYILEVIASGQWEISLEN